MSAQPARKATDLTEWAKQDSTLRELKQPSFSVESNELSEQGETEESDYYSHVHEKLKEEGFAITSFEVLSQMAHYEIKSSKANSTEMPFSNLVAFFPKHGLLEEFKEDINEKLNGLKLRFKYQEPLDRLNQVAKKYGFKWKLNRTSYLNNDKDLKKVKNFEQLDERVLRLESQQELIIEKLDYIISFWSEGNE
jgi:hypothetical protein